MYASAIPPETEEHILVGGAGGYATD